MIKTDQLRLPTQVLLVSACEDIIAYYLRNFRDLQSFHVHIRSQTHSFKLPLTHRLLIIDEYELRSKWSH